MSSLFVFAVALETENHENLGCLMRDVTIAYHRTSQTCTRCYIYLQQRLNDGHSTCCSRRLMFHLSSIFVSLTRMCLSYIFKTFHHHCDCHELHLKSQVQMMTTDFWSDGEGGSGRYPKNWIMNLFALILDFVDQSLLLSLHHITLYCPLMVHTGTASHSHRMHR